MPHTEYKAEAKLKAAVIDRLFSGMHVSEEDVVISEMTVANWTRRADVVLANGRLWGFEIKSEADKLSRLPGQIETFQKYFEKFIVVVSDRFEKAISTMIPEGVGLWIADSTGEIIQKTAPRQRVLEKSAYISLMTVEDLRALIRSNGIRAEKSLNRKAIEAMCLDLPTHSLAIAARLSIKNRYRDRYLAFQQLRQQEGTLASISEFRHPRNITLSRPIDALISAAQADELYIPVDHPERVEAPSGPVLKRRVN